MGELRVNAAVWRVMLWSAAAVGGVAAAAVLTLSGSAAATNTSGNCGGTRPASNPPGNCTADEEGGIHKNRWEEWTVGPLGAVSTGTTTITPCSSGTHNGLGDNCGHSPPSASGSNWWTFDTHWGTHGGHIYEWTTVCPSGSHRFGNGCHSHGFTAPCGDGTWVPHPGHTPIQQTPCEDDGDDEDDEPVDDEPVDDEPACVPGPGEHRHASSNTCHADHVLTPPPPPTVPSLSGVEVCRAGDAVQVSWSVSVPSGAAAPAWVHVDWAEETDGSFGGTVSVPGGGDPSAQIDAAAGVSWSVTVQLEHADGVYGDSAVVVVDDATAGCELECAHLEHNEAAANEAIWWNPVVPTHKPLSPRDPWEETGIDPPRFERRVILGAWMYPGPAEGSQTITDDVLGCVWVYAGGEISFDGEAAQRLPIADSGPGVQMLPDPGPDRSQRQVSWRMETWWRAEGEGFAEGDCDGTAGSVDDPVCAVAVEIGQGTYFDIHSFVERDL